MHRPERPLRPTKTLIFLGLALLAPAASSAQEDSELDLAALARRQASEQQIELSDAKQGEASFSAEGSGRCRVTMRCSTREGARLNLRRIDGKGQNETIMSWNRRNDRDPSPLMVNGEEREDSIFERSPGDFSPRLVEHAFDVARGETLRMSLRNDGGGTPELSFSTDAPGTIDMEDTEVEEASRGSDESKSLVIDPARSWTLEVEGKMGSTSGFARLIHGEGSVHRRVLDVFTRFGQGLNLRLANKSIFFVEARVGSIHNPGGASDHWFQTTVDRVSRGESVSLRIRNDAEARRLSVWWKGRLVGDVSYEIRSAAGTSNGLVFENLEGTARLR